MTAKEYLLQISKLESEIMKKQQRCKTLRLVATSMSINTSAEDIQKSKEKSPMESIMVKVIDIEREIEEEKAQLVAFRVEMLEELDLLSDNRYKQILWLHYAERKSWNEIAREMCLSRRHVLRLHKVALEKFEKIYKKN